MVEAEAGGGKSGGEGRTLIDASPGQSLDELVRRSREVWRGAMTDEWVDGTTLRGLTVPIGSPQSTWKSQIILRPY